jgi:hypothetical protein
MIRVGHLHYGKLVSEHRGPVSSEGYGVTRRSDDIKKADVAGLRLNALLAVSMFDTEMIDAGMAEQGLLFVRTLPPTDGAFANQTVLVRARFRSENGDGMPGRLHQQAAIWVVQPRDWNRYAPSILAKASSDLRADPDLAREPSHLRLGIPAKEIELLPDHQNGSDRLPDQVYRILDTLLPSAAFGKDDGSSRFVTFGGNSGKSRDGEVQGFDSEAEFLAAVGTALMKLNETTFSRWADICIGSGLRHTCNGLLIRYLKSEQIEFSRAADPSSIGRRLGKITVTARRDSKSAHSVLAETSAAAHKPAVEASRTPAAEPAASPSDGASFGKCLKAYRAVAALSAEPAAAKLAAAATALKYGADGAERATSSQLTKDEESAYKVIVAALAPPEDKAKLGTIFDCVEFHERAKLRHFDDVRKAWSDILGERLARTGILLPPELNRLKSARCFKHLHTSHPAVDAMTKDSQAVSDWIDELKDDSGKISYLPRPLIGLRHRLRDLVNPGQPQTEGTGIHGNTLIGVEALLSETEYNELPMRLTLSLLSPLLLMADLQPSVTRDFDRPL